MKIKTIITIWNTLSNLKPSKTTEGKLYALNAKKALRPHYNAYIDFEKDAYETLQAENKEIDNKALTEILLPEQMREVDITLPNLAENILMDIMDANPDIPMGAYDILLFNE